MFVTLTVYHGGGAAATIEPLDEHRDHYERMLQSNLGLGVQAVYRGFRLFDTEATKAVVVRNVDWYKQHRDILESDVVHGRRADGRDLDWMLHVNPKLDECGLLVVFNPLEREVTRSLRVPLYYTGLDERVRVVGELGSTPGMDLDPVAELPTWGRELELGRDWSIELEVTVPAGGMAWYSFARP